MIYPQFFSPEVSFLTVIPKLPTPESRNVGIISRQFHDEGMAAFYWQPESYDFVLQDPTRPSIRLGYLSPSLTQKLKQMSSELHQKYRKSLLTTNPSATDNLVRKDERLNIYDLSLQRLLQRLTRPASRSDCFTTLFLLQRTYLEFSAAYSWTTDFSFRCRQRSTVWDTEHVLGAFTDDLNTADMLFHAGIPVWVVHPVEKLLTLRIDCVCEPLLATTTKIALTEHCSLPLIDSEPPHRVIFNGQCNDLERYKMMSHFLRSLTLTGVLPQPSFTPSAVSGPSKLSSSGKNNRRQKNKPRMSPCKCCLFSSISAK